MALIRTPGGIALGPTREGEVLSSEDFRKLPEAEQDRFKADMEDVQRRLQETLRQVPKWDKGLFVQRAPGGIAEQGLGGRGALVNGKEEGHDNSCRAVSAKPSIDMP